MILLAEQSVSIAAPVDLVFAFAANLENFPLWFPKVADMRAVDSRPFAEPGKEYVETVSMPLGSKRRVKIRVKECDLNRHLRTEGDLQPILPRMEMEFSHRNGKTEVEWRMFARGEGFLFRRILAPLSRMAMQRRSSVGLRKLKDLLEAKERKPTRGAP